MDAPPGFPHGADQASLFYTDHLIPSFQHSVCSNLKVLPDHSVGHKIVPLGCYQDPNIYFLFPIMESQILPTSFTASSLGSSSPKNLMSEARHKRSHIMIHDSPLRDLRSTQHGCIPETCPMKDTQAPLG